MPVDKKVLKKFQDKGFFIDAQPTMTLNNIGLAAGILNSLSSTIIENVVAYRTGDEVLGKREKLIDWADEKYILPFVEQTGQTTPYADFGQAHATALNTSFNDFNHYRFSSKWIYGSLQAEQYSKAKIDYSGVVASASTEALAIELNRTAFNGYIDNTSNKFLCYGLLNNPQLSNYVNSAKTFSAMTWQEVMAFFGTAIKALTVQTGNNINGQSNIRVPISASAYNDLETKYTDLGVPVLETLLSRYKGMKFIPAIELDSAFAGDNVIYFIGESLAGGIPDTTKLGYSEIARVGNLVVGDNSWSQTVSAGTVGAIVYKPFMIVRYAKI